MTLRNRDSLRVILMLKCVWRLAHSQFVLWLDHVAWILYDLIRLFIVALVYHEFALGVDVWILRCLKRMGLYHGVSCQMSWGIAWIYCVLGVIYAIDSPISWLWSSRSNPLSFLATSATSFPSWTLCAPRTYRRLHRSLPAHNFLLRLFSFRLCLQDRYFITG